jgi:hypothetical protein
MIMLYGPDDGVEEEIAALTRPTARRVESLLGPASEHADDCDCNKCYDDGRGAWASGGFMNPA